MEQQSALDTTHNMSRDIHLRLPDRQQALWFWVRVRLLSLRRALRNLFDSKHRRWPTVAAEHSALADAPIIATVSTPLWLDGRTDEFVLTAGKIHNLRRARAAFDGVEIPAGEVWSFWAQLGRLLKRRGYVYGREVREGCVVPTIGGGVCQISNTLATLAVRSGMTLIERHAHTAKIEHATNQADDWVDATVFWNHVDLRIRAPFAWRLEMHLSADELTLSIRAQTAPNVNQAKPQRTRILPIVPIGRSADSATPPVARGCLTCNETACFRHADAAHIQDDAQSGETWLLDAHAPEFAGWLSSRTVAHAPRWLLPRPLTRAQTQRLDGWLSLHRQMHGTAPRWRVSDGLLALRRTAWIRWNARSQGKRQASLLDGQRWLARYYAHQLRPADVRLVIDQGLLPWLWRDGVLAGRRFTVLATALPMHEIVQRLDTAAARWPDAPSLTDFRMDAALADAECKALRAADAVVTMHATIADHLREQLPDVTVEHLPWQIPSLPSDTTPAADNTGDGMLTLIFPASTLPRKGWWELCAALHQLEAESRLPAMHLCVLGSLLPDAPRPPNAVKITHDRYAGRWLSNISDTHVLVLPAHVEHAPRTALRALTAGIPVIATPACGLPAHPLLTQIAAGDVAMLAQQLHDTFAASATQQFEQSGKHPRPAHQPRTAP